MTVPDHCAPSLASAGPQKEPLAACLAELGGEIVDFQFRGHVFFGIRLDDWVAQGASEATARVLRDHVAGRIVMDGDVFVIFGDASVMPSMADRSIVQRLTQRELKIAVLIAEGLTDKEIGRNLGISAYTVREHCRRACAKLNVSKRSALVRFLFTARLPV